MGYWETRRALMAAARRMNERVVADLGYRPDDVEDDDEFDPISDSDEES